MKGRRRHLLALLQVCVAAETHREEKNTQQIALTSHQLTRQHLKEAASLSQFREIKGLIAGVE